MAFHKSEAQTASAFSGTVTIVSSTYDGQGDYTIVVDNFRSPSSQYDQFDIQVGNTLWAENRLPSEPCNQYKILGVTYDPSGTITLTTRGQGIIGQQNRPKELPGAAITTNTEFNDFSIFMSSQPELEGFVSPTLQNCMITDAFIAIDSIGINQLDTFFFNQIQDTLFEFVTIYENNIETRDTFTLAITTNTATVNTDGVTAQGDGSTTDPVRVDTTLISTKTYAESIKGNFEFETLFVGADLTIGTNQILLSYNPVGTLIIFRNGVYQWDYSVSSQTITFNNYNFINNEEITIYHYN